MNPIKNDSGFSLIEIMISIALLGGLGVAAMQLSQTSSLTKTGLTARNDLEQTVAAIQGVISQPVKCSLNFKGLAPGSSITSLKKSATETLFKVGDLSNGKYYTLRSMSLEPIDPQTRQTRLRMEFSLNQDGKASKIQSKFISLAPKLVGGAIDGCIDPADLAADFVLKKMCFDVDPSDLTKNSDCLDNLANLRTEIRRLYCEAHPLFSWNSSLGTCSPLDAGIGCPGGYIQGYNGKTPSCYTHDTTEVVPKPRVVSSGP